MPALSATSNRPARLKRRPRQQHTASPAGPPTPSAPKLRQIRAQNRAAEAGRRGAAPYLSQARSIETQANRQRAQAQQDRQIRRAGMGGARDLLAQAVVAKHKADLRAQRRGWGSAAGYYRRNPAAAARTVVYGKDVGIKGAEGNKPIPALRAASIEMGYGPSSAQIAGLASNISKYGLGTARQMEAERKARGMAPVMKVLEQIQRPEYAVGGAIHGLKQGNIGKAISGAAKGAALQEKRTPGHEIIGKGGGVLGTIGRFALDVGLDPTTYVTFGGASIAGKTAIKAAERAASKAARARLSALAPDIASGKLTMRQAKRIAKVHGREQGAKKAAQVSRQMGERGGKRGITVRVSGGRTARRIGRRIAPDRAINTRRVNGKLVEREAFAPLTRATAGIRRERAGTSDLAKGGRNLGASLHAGVRPGGVTSAENAAIKSIKREGRATEEASVREANARANALLKKLDPEDEQQVIDAIEANRLSKLPEHLRDTAHDVRSYLRYVRRSERRAGSLSGEVGAESRSRAEIGHGARTQTPRKQEWKTWKTRKLEAQRERQRLTHIYYERTNVRSNPALRADVKDQILEAGKRERMADEALNALARKQTQAEGARVEARIAKRERLKEQAKGYFPRFPEEEIKAERGLLKRLAEPLKPQPTRVGSSKPRPETSKYREHRGSREQLREGTPQQRAVEASFTPNVRESVSLRGIRGARGVRNAQVNRKIAERFGEKLPGHAPNTIVADLQKSGKSIYRVERGDLVRLKAGDLDEIKNAVKSPAARAAVTQKKLAHMKAEGFTPAQIQREWEKSAASQRYVVLKDDTVARAQDLDEGGRFELGAAGEAWDAANRTFKSLALMTPAYLIRNLGGDMFNAWTEENVFRLMRNQARSQRALNALGKRERAVAKGDTAKSRKALQELGEIKSAGNRFSKMLSPKQRDIQLTPEQAREIAGPSADRLYNAIRKGNPDLSKDQIRKEIENRLSTGKVSPLHVAQLAEQMGVVRQGRFLELMQQGQKGFKRPKTWDAAVKRVEDSTRLATFMGGLQRGLSPREASERATKLHFDYGDLTAVEKNVLRRLMPFYTFPSRNIPLQAKQLVTRPGKYATVAKAQDAAAEQADMKRGWQQNLSEFEARQVPLPFKFGDKKVTVSLGAPFTDLNDVTSFAEGATALPRAISGQRTGSDITQLGEAPLKRAVESFGPWKVFGELRANQSGFFREPIEPSNRRLTRAPEWAAQIYKHAPPGLKDLIESTTELQIKDGVPMWRKKAPYTLRTVAPGIVGAAGTVASAVPGVPELGVKTGKDYRGRTKAERLIGIFGPRVVTYDAKQGRKNRAQAAYNSMDTKLDNYRERYKAAHNDKIWDDPADAPPAYRKMLAEQRRNSNRIERLEGKTEDSGPPLSGAAATRAERSRQIHNNNTSGAAALRAARANR